MPVSKDKKEFTAELNADPLKEMTKPAQDFIKGEAELSKAFVKITYKEKVSLDPRKWNKKDLDDAVHAVARYELKQLAVRVGEAEKKAKDEDKKGKGEGTADKGAKNKGAKGGGKADKGAKGGKGGKAGKEGQVDKKVVEQLKKEYGNIVKAIEKKVSLALEDLASDQEDNKKAMKDGKAAFAKLDKIDFNGAFAEPQKELARVLSELEAGIQGSGKQATIPPAALNAASRLIGNIASGFDKTGREANAAISQLSKSSKEFKKADSSGFQDLSKVIDGNKEFGKFLDMANKFEGTLGNIEKAVKGGKIGAEDVRSWLRDVQGMNELGKSAKAAQGAAKKLSPKFHSVLKSLKG